MASRFLDDLEYFDFLVHLWIRPNGAEQIIQFCSPTHAGHVMQPRVFAHQFDGRFVGGMGPFVFVGDSAIKSPQMGPKVGLFWENDGQVFERALLSFIARYVV